MAAGDDKNPFVGPRSLNAGNGIYGRDDEIRELQWLFTASRIVWLHSPSGAGKTSLVEAGLIPELKKDNFTVLPTIRVNREANVNGNRYEASVLSCLGGESNLKQFLQRNSTGASRVLIFDQFEEILTLDSTDVEAKREFFEGMGLALGLPDIWALFIIREDYLLGLDPYMYSIPTLMNHRYRLDLLTTDKAREAMRAIAGSGGGTFAEEASTSLAEELAKIRITSAEGEKWKRGRVVEPVIMQVVCRNMWQKINDKDAGRKVITLDDVPTGDEIYTSLGSFYANCISSLKCTSEQERAVRTWVGEKLIVSGFRNQVLDSANDGAGLGKQIIDSLVNSHLIRREPRGERYWYELSHDWLVEAIIADNRRWEEEHLHWVQQRAELWDRQEEPPSLLLVARELKSAERWKNKQPSLTPVESRFLEKSREKRKMRQRTIAVWILAGVAIVFFFLLGIFYLRDGTKQLILNSQNEAHLDQFGCAVQDASNAASRWYLGPDLLHDATESLRTVLADQDSKRLEVPPDNPSIAFNPATPVMAVLGGRTLRLYPMPAPDKVPSGEIRNEWALSPDCGDATFTAVSLNDDGTYIAFGLSNGLVRREQIDPRGERVVSCRNISGEQPSKIGTAAIEVVAFSRNGDLAAGSWDGVMLNKRLLYNLHTTALAFDSSAKQLAAGTPDGNILTLDLNGKVIKNDFPPFSENNSIKKVSRIAWGPGTLAAISNDYGSILVWDEKSQARWLDAYGRSSGFSALAVSPDGRLIAATGLDKDNWAKVWQVGSPSPIVTIDAPDKEAHFTDVVFGGNSHLWTADSGRLLRSFPLDLAALQSRAAAFKANNTCGTRP